MSDTLERVGPKARPEVEPHEEGPRRLVAVHHLINEAAAAFPQRTAVDFFGRTWTYAEIAASVDRAAAGLQALGIAKGDRVGLCLPNTPYSVIAYYAVLAIGAVVVNFNPLSAVREIEHQIRDSGTSAMVVIDVVPVFAKVAEAVRRTGVTRIVLCPLSAVLPLGKAALFRVFKHKHRARLPAGDPWISWARLLGGTRAVRPVPIVADDLAVLQYTGGTTGTPKGAMLTHANVLANTWQVVAYDPTRMRGQERVLGVLPLFHVFAMTVVMNYAVAMAAAMVLLPRYDLKATLKALLRCKPTVFPAVPTIYGAIARLAEAKRRDLSYVRLCISGGAPLPQEIGERFQRVTGTRLVEGYGLTEASPVVACNPSDGSGKPGSIGLPLVGTTVEIRDPVTRERVPTGAKGELVIRGPQVMRGYWNQPAETAVALDGFGLRTGDIGTVDEDGYIFIVDRIKDIILCGGYNVYPRVIEDALYQHPDVCEAVAIGIPDPYRGQSAKAFVVLRVGSAVHSEDLTRFLGDYLSKIEQPKLIEIRESLPKTAVGKLSRKELVEEERCSREQAA